VSARLDIAFFGSSILSAYWNGAATYYRGIVRGLAEQGHRVTFFEPDAFDRQKHRDLQDMGWVRVVVYDPDEAGVQNALDNARHMDLVVKCWYARDFLGRRRSRHPRSRREQCSRPIPRAHTAIRSDPDLRGRTTGDAGLPLIGSAGMCADL